MASMSESEKLARLMEALGPTADPTLAREVLAANEWNLTEAMNLLVGEAAPPARPAPVPVQARTPAPAAFGGLDGTAGDTRAPMRTGFFETLMEANPAEQRRQDEEREAERKRLEEERIAAEEQRRRDAEEAYNKGQARLAQEQRLSAEKQAMERKKQKMEQELAEARSSQKPTEQRRGLDDSDDDIPLAPPVQLSALSAQLAGSEPAEPSAPAAAPAAAPAPAPASRQPRLMQDSDDSDDNIPMPAMRLSDLAAQVGTGQPEPAAPQAAETPSNEVPAAAPAAVRVEPEPSGPSAPPADAAKVEAPPPETKAVDPVVRVLKELRKRFREANPAGLAAALRIISGAIGHLVEDPQETKYHRLNCAGEKFRSRVENLEGAVDVLEACGFRREGDFLLVDTDYPRTHGLRLRDAKAKIDMVLSELAASGCTG
mmetsp:Transcript_44726/g.83538  ORF Transcript_44726/g.83538 Transcript_44726/m.83538 type:complete len:430 (+) Transcript_44726:57-1346(+)